MAVSAFNSLGVHMHVQRKKFQNNCSLKYRQVFCIGRARDALAGFSFFTSSNLCVHMHMQMMKFQIKCSFKQHHVIFAEKTNYIR